MLNDPMGVCVSECVCVCVCLLQPASPARALERDSGRLSGSPCVTPPSLTTSNAGFVGWCVAGSLCVCVCVCVCVCYCGGVLAITSCPGTSVCARISVMMAY